MEKGIFCVGPAMGLIDSVLPVKTLLDEIVAEAESAIERLRRIAADRRP